MPTKRFLKGIVDYDYLSNALYFKRTAGDQAAKEMTKLKPDETALKKSNETLPLQPFSVPVVDGYVRRLPWVFAVRKPKNAIQQ